jgi:hypothetical protein
VLRFGALLTVGLTPLHRALAADAVPTGCFAALNKEVEGMKMKKPLLSHVPHRATDNLNALVRAERKHRRVVSCMAQ